MSQGGYFQVTCTRADGAVLAYGLRAPGLAAAGTEAARRNSARRGSRTSVVVPSDYVKLTPASGGKMRKALAVLLLAVPLALAACGSAAPASTEAGCEAAFARQIQYSESRHLVHPNLPTPAQCSGLPASQVQLAALDAVTEEMP